MSTFIEKIVDVTTGEETLRPYTSDEIAEVNAKQKDIDEKNALKQQEIEKQQSERLAVLVKLGITEDEARLLLGGN